MKIGIDVRCLMNRNYCGVSWYTFNLLSAMFSIDKENDYILFYNNSKPVKMPKFGANNVEYRGFKYPNKALGVSFNLFNKPEIDKMIGGVDVMFVPNINFMSFSSDCKKIITVHDLSFLRYPQFFTLKSRVWHRVLMYKKVLQRADVLIAVSSSTKNDLIDLLGIPEEKIKVIYEGVDPKFKIITNEVELGRVRRRYKLPPQFILYLGALEPRKNIEGIIEAYNNLDTNQYLVIGGGVGWKSQEIKKLVAKNDKIKLIGYVDEEDKRALYNLASLFVYPSYYEGFGLPLLEAMACGVPVVAGANSSQIEVVGNSGLLVDPYNINEISGAMDILLKDISLKEKMITSGLERSAKYNWNNTAINTIKILYENRNRR